MGFTFTASATVANRAVTLQALDGNGLIFNQTLIAGNIGANVALSEYGDLMQPSPNQPILTQTAEASVTSPGALTIIAAIGTGAAPAGNYQVSVVFNMAGTPVQAVDANNIELITSGQTIPLDNNIGTAAQSFGPFSMTTGGLTSIKVQTIGAATAGAIYSAVISAQPSLYAGEFQFPDLIMKSGWTYQLAVQNAQAGDQISNVVMLMERFPTGDIDRLDDSPENQLAELILRIARGG
jgi:hypothetical protein